MLFRPRRGIQKPSNEYQDLYIFENDPEVAKLSPYPENEGGKWMMFFDVSRIDKKWKEACKLYREGKVIEHHFLLAIKLHGHWLF